MGVGRKRWALSVRLGNEVVNLTRQRMCHTMLLFQKIDGKCKNLGRFDRSSSQEREDPDLVKTVFCLLMKGESSPLNRVERGR